MWQNEWHRLNCRTRKPEAGTETSAEHPGSSPKPIKHASVHLCSHSLVIVNGWFFGSCIASVTKRKSVHKCLSAIIYFYKKEFMTPSRCWLLLCGWTFNAGQQIPPSNRKHSVNALSWILLLSLMSPCLTSLCVFMISATNKLKSYLSASATPSRKHTVSVTNTKTHPAPNGSFLAFQCQPT